MAQERINYKLNIDQGNSAKNLGQLEQKFERLQKQIKNTDFGTKEFNRLQQEIKETDSQLRQMDLQMEGMDTEQLAGRFGDLAMAGGDLAGAFTLVTGAGEEAQKTFNQVFGALTGIEGAIRGPIAAMELWRQRTQVLIPAQRALNAVMRANPAGLIATAIGALAAGFATYLTVIGPAEQKQKKLNDSMKRTSKLTDEMGDKFADEASNVRKLTLAIENTNEGTERRDELIGKLQDKYGEYIDNIRTEEGELRDLDEIQGEIIQNLREQFLVKQLQNQLDQQLQDNAKILNDQFQATNKILAQNSDDLGTTQLSWGEFNDILKENDEITEGVIKKQFDISDLAAKRNPTAFQKLVTNIQAAKQANTAYEDSITNLQNRLQEMNARIKINTEEQNNNNEETKESNEVTKRSATINQELVNELIEKEAAHQDDINAVTESTMAYRDLLFQLRQIQNEYERENDFIKMVATNHRQLTNMKRKNEEEMLQAKIERIAAELTAGDELNEAHREDLKQRLKDHKESLREMKEEERRMSQDLEGIISDRIIEGAEVEDKQMQEAVGRSTEIATDTINQAFERAMQQRQERIDQQRKMEVQAAKDTADAKISILEAQLENETITEEEFARKQAQIKRNQRMAEYNAKVKEFEAEKDLELTRLAINTSAAIVQTWAQLGWPAGAIVSAALAASAAVQAAQIESQEPPPPPQFEKGGIVGGRRHSEGGTMIEAEEGEVVLNRNVGGNPAMLEMASAINEATGGESFAESGGARREGSQKEQEGPVKAVVVEKDITEKQNKQKRREKRAKL